MNKTIYTYIVGKATFTDSEPFKKAWKEAQAEAARVHLPIYRTEVKISRTVYARGGCFLDTEYVDADRMAIL